MSVERCAVTLASRLAVSAERPIHFRRQARGELLTRRRRSFGLRPAGHVRGGAAGEHDQPERHAESDPPVPALVRQREEGFDEEWIGQQADEAAGIAGGVEPVGVAAAAGEPRLQQRRRCGECEVRQADRPKQPQHQRDHGRRFDAVAEIRIGCEESLVHQRDPCAGDEEGMKEDREAEAPGR